MARSAEAPAVLLEARSLSRRLHAGGVSRAVVDDVSLTLRRGEFVALTGASGSGKSSLLYLLGVLDRPDAGDVLFAGRALGALDDDARSALRREHLGFVFQFHFLLPEFSALENVMLPLLRLGRSPATARRRAAELLAAFDLGGLGGRKPGQLSGGQQQRVAIARAVANDPPLVLADEPTGSLDSGNAERVIELLAGLAREQRRAVLMVTHAPDLAARADRRIRLKDGRVVGDDAGAP